MCITPGTIHVVDYMQVIDEVKTKKNIDLDLEMEAEDWKHVSRTDWGSCRSSMYLARQRYKRKEEKKRKETVCCRFMHMYWAAAYTSRYFVGEPGGVSCFSGMYILRA